jgi:uncharacterized protein YcbX
MSEVVVSGLHVYPIKSCAGIDLESTRFTEFGLVNDRVFALMDENGVVLTQRIHPELALVQPKVNLGSMYVSAPDHSSFRVSLTPPREAFPHDVEIWKKTGTGTRVGGEADEFFNDYLRHRSRVHLMQLDAPRHMNPNYMRPGDDDRMAFQDGFNILLTSMASLAILNEQLERQGDATVSMDRFRPNIVVSGAEAFDEDFWREIEVGVVEAAVRRVCERCAVPNIRQNKTRELEAGDQPAGTLERDPKKRAVKQALEAIRSGREKPDQKPMTYFGQNAVHTFVTGATVRLGDKIKVVRRDDTRNFELLSS